MALLACGCAQGISPTEDAGRPVFVPDTTVPRERDLGMTTDGSLTVDADPRDLASADAADQALRDVADVGPCPEGCGTTEVCRPTGCVDVCVEAAAQCGDVDGIDCGGCGAAEVCADDVCIAPCGTMMAECGSLRWAGGVVDCGACATGSCFANQCAQPGFRSVAGGFAHTCAVSSTGRVDCWGDNNQGALGNVGGNRSTPAAVPGLTGMAQISTFNQHVCASKPTGTWCWGSNAVGQLGNGTLTPSDSPTPVSGGFDDAALAVGGAHTCSLRGDGTARCWGVNGQGQLGTGALGGQSTSPLAVINLTNLIALAAGGAHTCALRDDGNVYCWGWNEKGQLGNAMSAASAPARVDPLPPMIGIAAGQSHTCAISDALEVWCWGEGISGQLGRGSTASSNVPVKASLSGAVAVIAGREHTCAIDTARRIYCWGANARGQLGIGTVAPATTPTMIGTLSNVLSAGAGLDHTCAALDDGTAWCWGANGSGQLGNNSTVDAVTPVQVSP